MNAPPQEHAQPNESAAFAPLDADITFTVQAEILGIRGPLEIRAQRVSSIQRVLRLLKQNNVLVEQASLAQASSGEPPICPVHNRPMKASKKPGAWFCSAKVGEGYCDQKVG
jgi:hypothetical protein